MLFIVATSSRQTLAVYGPISVPSETALQVQHQVTEVVAFLALRAVVFHPHGDVRAGARDRLQPLKRRM
jgi:uncharacterized membrane protein